MHKNTSAKAQKKKLNIVHLTDGKSNSLLDSETWIPVSTTSMVRNPARTAKFEKEEQKRREAFQKAHPKMSPIKMVMEFVKQEMKNGTYLPLMVVESVTKF